MRDTIMKRLLRLGGCLALIFGVFFGVVRPWYLHWGATQEEDRRAMPGDEIILKAAGEETRAITIHAPVDRVWPWLAQLGQDRGGFYSFDILENIVGCDMPTDDRLRPDRQSWSLGDKLWMYPADKAGGVGFATLRSYEPGRALGFGTHAVGTPPTAPEDGSWSFTLDSIDDASATRLIVRGRGAGGRGLLGAAFDRSIFEPVHFVMERRMMVGIKDVAEGRDRDRIGNHVQVVFWTLTFVCFVASVVMVLTGSRTMAIAGLFVSAGVFQLLTFVQPPVLVGGALTALAMAVLAWPVSHTGAIVRTGHPATQRP
jgi:hypothetical protein